MTRPTRSAARVVPALVVAALAVGGFSACSSDAKTTTTSTGSGGSSTTAPEQKISSDADVAAGLKKLASAATDVAAAGTDKAKAQAAIDKLEPIWKDIEGTVKQKDPDAYTQIEEDLALLGKAAAGDAENAKKGAADMATTVDSYLAKHPG
jgi:hypothetical protein